MSWAKTILALAVVWASLASAADIDEFKVKRQEVFGFAEKPRVTRNGDLVAISFTSKGYCDATVAIENAEGRIVRHVASGVLGPNAPEPFKKDSPRQTLVWNGKDDQDRYVDNKDAIAVRVSLGIKPTFERTLFWSPYKRLSSKTEPLIHATPEGVYVLDSKGTDHLRLYSHEGEYVRTVYPFPRGRLARVDGLTWQTFPQDGAKLPLKHGIYQCTLLTSGVNASVSHSHKQHGLFGSAATAMAVRDGRIALAYFTLNRFSTDSTTDRVPLAGPKVTVRQVYGGGSNWRPETDEVTPKSAAISLDGKWLYLTRYTWDKYRKDGWYHNWHCLHGVVRLPLDGDAAPKLFVGSMNVEESGTDEKHFRCATSVAVDARGRVYVSDYMNDRIQVYSPDGQYLKTIPVAKPVQVLVHQRTGEMYVFSWMLVNQFLTDRDVRVPATMTRLGPLESPRKVAACPLPLEDYVDHPGGFKGYANGHRYRVELDSWTEPPAIWLVPGVPGYTTVPGAKYGAAGKTKWEKAGIRLLVEKDGQLAARKDFSQEAARTVVRLKPPDFARQRLYVNPVNRKLYLAEDLGFNKSFMELVEIDPETGQVRLVPLPFDAEDLAFDLDGLAYLRTRTIVGRYDFRTWREVPWDYGEERLAVSNGGGKAARMISGIPLHSATLWHHGGMSVSAKGHLVAACTAETGVDRRQAKEKAHEGRRYQPRLYPGRVVPKKGAIIHVWDRHGKLVHEDGIPGLSNLNGVYIDNEDGLYVMSAQRRILDGTPYFNSKTGTLMKFRPRQGRIVSSSDRAPIPLSSADTPQQKPDLHDHAVGRAWVKNAEWLYGGVGFDPVKDNFCACSNSRFSVDYFGRPFAPEVGHYSVAVLDTNGNLILRIGQYGNVDDGKPLILGGGPSGPRSIGGDEVALFHACYVATDTDRRLFIADFGNARILSVRLDYHVTERVALRDVPDQARGE